MKLTQLYKNLFEPAVRDRGQQYFDRGYAELREVDDDSATARVFGTEEYMVTIERGAYTLSVDCECPHFEQGNFCKHLWAVFLNLDASGNLQMDTEPMPQLTHPLLPDAVLPDTDRVGRSGSATPTKMESGGRAPERTWRDDVTSVRTKIDSVAPRPRSVPAQIGYIIEAASSLAVGSLCIRIAELARHPSGQLTYRTLFEELHRITPFLPEPADRIIVTVLAGGQLQTGVIYSWRDPERPWKLLPDQIPLLMPMMIATGRCFLHKKDVFHTDLTWEGDRPLQARLRLTATADAGYLVAANLYGSNGKAIPASKIHLLVPGVAIVQNGVHPVSDSRLIPWVSLTHRTGGIQIPAAEVDQFLEEHFNSATTLPIELPRQLGITKSLARPIPILRISSSAKNKLEGHLSFRYHGIETTAQHHGSSIYDTTQRQLILRDQEAESAATSLLLSLRFRPRKYGQSKELWEISAKNFLGVVRRLNTAGWIIEAEGKLYRGNGAITIAVKSEIDWFEVHGTAAFGEAYAQLPQILAALQGGHGTILLNDGSYGMLPEEWLKKYEILATLGESATDHIRFRRSQTGLLDALLLSQPEITFDAGFQQARKELQWFQSIQPAQPPQTFVGTLRQYQKEGLGWMKFLQEFHFGGCLADDMGLGKTVQALALLESRRLLRQETEHATGKPAAKAPKKNQKKNPAAVIPPSLVVVPKSLVFNWIQEAEQFTPKLRVLNNTGAARHAIELQEFYQYDVILTTYGTLRSDAPTLKDFRFDYIILDEAQAIKNASTVSAKAARLLQANHRLAMSGTPIENHIGELWSLFEFLHPGMLGRVSVFQSITDAANPDDQSRTAIARAIRPFILRRTKEQVAKELPAKNEQTIYCELEPTQRKLYNELRTHYRSSILGLVDDRGLNRAKMQILEALLRLRQLACHPGLIDKTRAKEGSAKLSLLIPQLAEVVEEGHKVLVFSQFTSFLAIVKQRLDAEGIRYEYLDGKTTNRQQKVQRFQNDPSCKLFLISLKAGGLGLNLTAAEYVFLLDPWWNPAVEAQAIDRAHRIGQKKKVFAYRFIARDTVEEKVLQLQESKRQLADAIINADNALIRNLSKEDLELLLS